MPITYSFDPSEHVIHTLVTGEARLATIREHLNAISAEPWFPAPAVVDVRLAGTGIPSAEVRSVVDIFRRLGPRLDGAPIAVIVASDVAYGLVRMMEIMLDDVVSIAPFHDMASARAWLAESLAARRVGTGSHSESQA